MKKLLGLAFIALSLFAKIACAQDIAERANIFYRFVYKPYEFKFQLEDSLGVFTNVSNKVFKPKGEGPFPAVVLIHTSGGLTNGHIKRDAEKLVEKGYVALVLDSMGPRRISLITESTRALYPPAGVKDAYIALDFLKTKVMSIRIAFTRLDTVGAASSQHFLEVLPWRKRLVRMIASKQRYLFIPLALLTIQI